MPRTSEAPTCPTCQREGELLYRDLRDRLFSAPGVWGIRRCGSCALAWLDPQPVSEDIHVLYSDYYTHENNNGPADLRTPIRDGLLAARFGYDDLLTSPVQRIAGALLGSIPAISDRAGAWIMWLPSAWRGELLDVGCGSGRFLDRMRSLGWDVYGIDPDPVAVDHARSRGLDVHLGTVESADLKPDSYDAITFTHVIEHLPDPRATLKRCGELLRKGGILVITTPNLGALGHRLFKEHWRGLEVPRHLRLYSSTSLTALLLESGFSVTSVRTTARVAGGMWGTSRWLRRHPDTTLGTAIVDDRRLSSLVFWVAEDLLGGRRRSGEELLAIARKDDG